MLFAKVIIDLSVKSLDRPFQYRVPEEMTALAIIGAPVVIPFGKGNCERRGFIIGLSETPEFDPAQTKSILRVEKQGVIAESHLLSLAYWMKEQYGSTMHDAIRAVMPVRQESREKVARQILPVCGREDFAACRAEFDRKHNAARVRLMDGMLGREDFEAGISYEYAVKELSVPASVIRGLAEKGLVTVTSRQVYRNPLIGKAGSAAPKKLNAGQQAVVDVFGADYDAGLRKTYLLHGVTGSGKTEVYMHLIEHVLQKGQQAILLIPEIALTYQTVSCFTARFGDRVSILHSRLSMGERYDQYLRAKRGKIQIMIGPRSALFTPFQRLGLIVIDEEHETGYQSDTMPKYHAREVAVQRAKLLHASVMLGSATPSMEAYYRCQKGEYTLFTLKGRAGSAIAPKVEIVDLREELKAKNYSIFSRTLQEKIEDRLQKKEQTMLFINRRGYAGFVSCRACGKVIECDHCSVSMKPHVRRGKLSLLKCHYCGAQKPMPQTCPSCGSKYIGTFGLGTQQVEDLLRKRFPAARVLRMDADTTTGKEGHERILKRFAGGEADILIGTQMIVKGHDFKNVTLVGALAADLSLNTGDYRAAERTFQLLLQAAGRAGRAEKSGEAVFQTYRPEHYSIVCAAQGDYEAFYRQEILQRQMLQYPPVSNILEVLVSSRVYEKAEKLSALLAGLAAGSDVTVLGPSDANVARVKEMYRRVFYLKAGQYALLRQKKDDMEAFLKERKERDCFVTFTFNG